MKMSGIYDNTNIASGIQPSIGVVNEYQTTHLAIKFGSKKLCPFQPNGYQGK